MPADLKDKLLFPWGHGRRFNAYSNYLRKIYGTRIQKVSIDAGFTCPNRDGTKGTGGCTYCNNDAFNPSYCTPERSIKEQIDEGISFHKWRYRKAVSYLAYFQAYSNTYASLAKLRELYQEALSYPGVVGIIIGTRPDCVDKEKLDFLKEISEKYYLVVEYGIESCYNKTLTRINRGHTFEEAVNAVKATAALGINTGAHFIFGLPGETIEAMLSEAEIISLLPLKTVKFHQLQIIKGTAINNDGNRKVGYTAPSVEGEADVIRAALQVAEIEPESISYIETHGTATILGDPIEITVKNYSLSLRKREAEGILLEVPK